MHHHRFVDSVYLAQLNYGDLIEQRWHQSAAETVVVVVAVVYQEILIVPLWLFCPLRETSRPGRTTPGYGHCSSLFEVEYHP